MWNGTGDWGSRSVQLCGGCSDPNQSGYGGQKGVTGKTGKENWSSENHCFSGVYCKKSRNTRVGTREGNEVKIGRNARRMTFKHEKA